MAKMVHGTDGWPDGDQPISFVELTDPILRAIKFNYSLRRKNADKDTPWDGPDIGKGDRACCFSPDELLTAENLAISKNDQFREAIEEIVGLAVRLGIEQGRRIEKNSLANQLRSLAKGKTDE